MDPKNSDRQTASRFRNTWERRRHDLKDPSQSGYDLALADFGVAAGLSEQQIVDLTGVPRAVESSIYGAATRKQMRVSVYVRPSAVYICKGRQSESLLKFPAASKARCLVCGAALHSKPGTSRQFVCAGTRKKKSECQKVWRFAREHGIAVEEAKQRREGERSSQRAVDEER